MPVALLQCVLNYPTEDASAHLGMIRGLQKKFPNNIIGYSDHTMPKNMKSLETATLLGAAIPRKNTLLMTKRYQETITIMRWI